MSMSSKVFRSLTVIAAMTALTISINNRAATAEQHDGNSQMNHEQMMNSDGQQMPMPECSDNSEMNMNQEQMGSEEHQMSMKKCPDNSEMNMNHEMMNSDERQMPRQNDSPTSDE